MLYSVVLRDMVLLGTSRVKDWRFIAPADRLTLRSNRFIDLSKEKNDKHTHAYTYLFHKCQ